MNYDGYGWIKVKRYEMDESLSWEERHRQLEQHHIEETTFLIAEVRRVAAALEAAAGERDQLREHMLQTRSTLQEWVDDCCGEKRRFCDNYGCSSIRNIVEMLDVRQPAQGVE